MGYYFIEMYIRKNYQLTTLHVKEIKKHQRRGLCPYIKQLGCRINKQMDFWTARRQYAKCRALILLELAM